MKLLKLLVRGDKIKLEKQFILLNIFMKLRNKITEDIKKTNKPYLMLHGLNSVLKCVVQKICSSAAGKKNGQLE